MRYKDKVVLITAAANGIGRATCDIVAREGGIVIAVREASEIPVKFIGIGETPADVQPFDPGAFVEALFSA